MKIILLSGGAGKRLWPLSSELLPKQFMKILKSDTGESISMVQKTWRQLISIYGTQSIYLTTSVSHEAIVREQLGPSANLILEPSARDTFPAISLACSYLESGRHASSDETIVALPVDAFVQTDFYNMLTKLEETVQLGKASIALIGIRPKFPSEKYGYIVPKATHGYAESFNIMGFFEKPDTETAARLIEQGALWNSGIFGFRLSYMTSFLEQSNYPVKYAELLNRYDSIPRISFDYMVVEPEKRLHCHVYEGAWTDLGTWSDLVHALRPGQGDRVILDDNCVNTYVINQLDIPIIVAGISHAVVAASPDGILISDQSVSHTIKPLIDQLAGGARSK